MKLNDEETQIVKERARKAGLRLSAYLRQRGLSDEAPAEVLTTTTDEGALVREFKRELFAEDPSRAAALASLTQLAKQMDEHRQNIEKAHPGYDVSHVHGPGCGAAVSNETRLCGKWNWGDFGIREDENPVRERLKGLGVWENGSQVS